MALSDNQKSTLAQTVSFMENDHVRAQVETYLRRAADRMPAQQFEDVQHACKTVVQACEDAAIEGNDSTYEASYRKLKEVQGTIAAQAKRVVDPGKLPLDAHFDAASVGDYTVVTMLATAVNNYIDTYEGKSHDRPSSPPPPPF